MKNLILLAGMILLIPAAFGIGRSGNGTVNSSVNGFSLEVPESFTERKNLGSEKVRFTSIVLEPSKNGLQKLFLEISGLKEALPGLAKFSRSQLPRKMNKLGWTQIDSNDPCILAFHKSSDNGESFAAFWGNQKGVVAIGPKSANAAIALQHLRNTLQLKEGACSW